ncbi:MAG: chitinase [Bacteroidetes bacterium]|nr:chitinase [Bacteroidota bacterium]
MKKLPYLFSFFLALFFLQACAAVEDETDDVIVANKKNTQTNLTKFLDAKKWDSLFPNRFHISTYQDTSFNGIPKNDFYSFDAFVAAAKQFPLFLGDGNDSIQRRELAAFLANMAHETNGGWDNAPGGVYLWGLYFIQEKGYPNDHFNYSDTSKKKWLPVTGKSYHGRGPMQLSWNYNYGQFSEAYFGNKQILLDNPDLLLKDSVLCFASAIWFWVRDQYPKPSCHDLMAGQWEPTAKDIAGGRGLGFGTVVNVINGGLECGENHSERTKYRYGFYQYFCDFLHIDKGPNAECSTQKPFGL